MDHVPEVRFVIGTSQGMAMTSEIKIYSRLIYHNAPRNNSIKVLQSFIYVKITASFQYHSPLVLKYVPDQLPCQIRTTFKCYDKYICY